ncbi:hypothetical protein [Actinomyces qiguomingii]|uniref:hypothetical protein n=1 Tax=Actinomyces qiguomingii TaxID=2057800 RepID=UPI000CA053C6|nr:hypothetical protein [Actinomyces qiguomingii]
MSATAVHVTLIYEGGAIDVAAPPGMRIDELLASQEHLPISGAAAVSTASGTPITTRDLLGTDVREGAVLVVADNVAAADQSPGHPHLPLRSFVRTPFWMAEALAIVLAMSVLLLILVPPLLPEVAAPAWPTAVRLTTAGLLLALLFTLALPRTAPRGPVPAALRALSLPLLGAAASVTLVPTKAQDWALLTGLVTLWGGAGTAMGLWLRHRAAAESVSAASWAAAAAVTTASIALGLWGPLVALLGMALAVLAGLVIPNAALVSVPDRQLLDMTGQRAAGQSVRTPITSPGVRVTRMRTRRTVDEAEAISVALEIALGALVVVCAPVVFQVASGRGVESWGARAEIVFALALLLLRPRTARSHSTRIIPRVSAGAAFCVSVLAALDRSWPLVGVVLAAAVVSMTVGAFTTMRRSAWWGRLGDVFERASAFLVLPAAVVAAGLIEVMRQM